MPPASVDDAVAALSGLVRDATTGAGRTHARARYTLFLEALSDPEVAAIVNEGRAAVLEWGARSLAAHIDGLVMQRLAFPGEDADDEAGPRALIGDVTSGI